MRKLETLDAFTNLVTIDSTLLLAGLPNLTNLSNFSKLLKVNELYVSGATLSNIPNGYNDISGLQNIDYTSLQDLTITYCPNLSLCEYKPICDYLEQPNAVNRINDNADGCNSKEEILEACMEVGTSDVIALNEITIYPNPTSTFFQIENNWKNQIEKWTLLDVLGRKVLEGQKIPEQIDVTILDAGTYLFCLYSEKKAITKKVTITNNRR